MAIIGVGIIRRILKSPQAWFTLVWTLKFRWHYSELSGNNVLEDVGSVLQGGQEMGALRVSCSRCLTPLNFRFLHL